jgi:hypothetical protein
MSIIRNLLYSGSSLDALHSGILYNQNLLHNFLLQHQPKFILHCGCPENALNLAYFAKENQPCEILHIKNWNPSVGQWLEATGEAPNPHKTFLDKIADNKLEDHLISFDGLSETASEVLSYRNFSFNMMISDAVGNNTNYMPLLKLLQKNAAHIRFIGNKKISDIKDEPIFQTDMEISFTYAQGYLITGMDYLSLYDGQEPKTENYDASNNQNTYDANVNTYQANTPHNIESLPQTDVIDALTIATEIHPDDTAHTLESPQLTPREIREQKRLERRKEREERRNQRLETTPINDDNTGDGDDAVNHSNTTDNTDNEDAQQESNHKIVSELLPFEFENDGTSTISAARRALRARRAARRQAMANT